MVGIPKYLNSKDDYEYVRANYSEEIWRPQYQNLLDTTYDWFFSNKLTDDEDGITDDTHIVIEDEETHEKSQYEWRLNPTCKLLSIGYTINEVKNILK
jgi:hypothetical protein